MKRRRKYKYWINRNAREHWEKQTIHDRRIMDICMPLRLHSNRCTRGFQVGGREHIEVQVECVRFQCYGKWKKEENKINRSEMPLPSHSRFVFALFLASKFFNSVEIKGRNQTREKKHTQNENSFSPNRKFDNECCLVCWKIAQRMQFTNTKCCFICSTIKKDENKSNNLFSRQPNAVNFVNWF